MLFEIQHFPLTVAHLFLCPFTLWNLTHFDLRCCRHLICRLKFSLPASSCKGEKIYQEEDLKGQNSMPFNLPAVEDMRQLLFASIFRTSMREGVSSAWTKHQGALKGRIVLVLVFLFELHFQTGWLPQVNRQGAVVLKTLCLPSLLPAGLLTAAKSPTAGFK